MKKPGEGLVIKASCYIDRSPGMVWDYMLDPAREKHWRDGVRDAQMTSDPPYGIGSSGLHFTERMGDWPWTIIEWEEGHLMGWEFSGGMMKGSYGSYRIEPDGAGSCAMIEIELRHGGVSGLVMRLMKSKTARILANDLLRLKAILETAESDQGLHVTPTM